LHPGEIYILSSPCRSEGPGGREKIAARLTGPGRAGKRRALDDGSGQAVRFEGPGASLDENPGRG
jgi:hypothetical protein